MAAKKVTTLVNGVPHTTTAAKAASSAPISSGNSGAAPARGQAGWVDPIRAPGDTRYTDKFGTPTPQGLNNANSPDIPANPTGVAQQPTQAPVSPLGATVAQTGPTGPQTTASSSLAPVVTPAASPTPTQNKYQQGLAAAQASGVAAPNEAGVARSAVTAYTPPQAPDTTNVDNFLSQDPAINTLMSGITKLLNPAKQTSTLMQDYTKLRKDSGLDKINAEMIDAETVINGTEDDIRNEIQTAGGMGTESQVQAMTLARNKSLLTRYNQLVQQKTDATNQLNTMMQLNQQDKQMAQERVNTQISAMFNMANFRQQALQNTRQQQQWLMQQDPVGYYNSLSKDPRQLAFAEQIMGTGQGGIQQIAQHYQEQQDFARSVQQEQLNISRGQLGVSQGNLALERQKYADSKNGSNQTSAQIQVQGYADRTKAANATITQVGSKFTGLGAKVGGIFSHLPVIGNALASSDRQQLEQAQRNFVNSVLRRESGAAISDSEFSSAERQYFPSPGDSAAVVAQKTANRNMVVNNLYAQSGAARPADNSDIIVAPNGQHFTSDASGRLIPI